MNRSRVSIATLMVAVLIAAVDSGAIRALLGLTASRFQLGELLAFGALPMANVLGCGLFVLVRPVPASAGGRPRLVGFEVAGAAALLLFLAAVKLSPGVVYRGVGEVLNWFGIRPGWVKASGAAALILAPQLGLALLGARLGRAYEVRARPVASRSPGPGASGPPPDCRPPGGALPVE